MAKAKTETTVETTAEVAGFSMGKGGAGWKSCPSCDGFVKGPLTKVCPNCKHEFVFKPKGEKAEKATKEATVDRTKQLLMFALSCGGVVHARKEIEKLQSNPVMELAISCGGVANTLRLLDLVEGDLSKSLFK